MSRLRGVLGSSWGHEDDRPLWAPRRVPIIVPLLSVAVLTAMLAMGPLFQIWQRTHGEAFDCSDPGLCVPVKDLTGPLTALLVILSVGLAAAGATIVWRARDESRWREVDSER